MAEIRLLRTFPFARLRTAVIVAALFFGADRSASGQPVEAPVAPVVHLGSSEILVRHWTTADGLPTNFVHGIAQTSEGLIGLATIAGLVVFDGRQFRRIETRGTREVGGPYLVDLGSDGKGGLWLHDVYQHLLHWNGSEIVSLSDDSIPFGSKDRIGTARDGTVWIRSNGRIQRVADRRVSNFLSSDSLPSADVLHELAAPGEGRWGFVTADGMLVGIEGGRRILEVSVPERWGQAMWAIESSDDGSWTIETNSHEVIRIDSTGSLSQVWEPSHPRATAEGIRSGRRRGSALFELAESEVMDPARARMIAWGVDEIILEERTAGVLCFVRPIGTLCLDIPAEIAFTDIKAGLIDHEGSVWFATDRGLFQLTRMRVRTQEIGKSPASNSVRAIIRLIDGSVAVGTWGDGVAIVRGEDIRYLGIETGLPSGYVWSLLQEPDGRLWVGTNQGGISYLDPGATRFKTVETGTVRAIVRRLDGSIWFSHFNSPTFEPAGVRQWRNGVVTRVDIGMATEHTGYEIWDLLEDRAGALWIGTTRGLLRLADGTTELWTKEKGLSQDYVVDIFQDSRGGMWFSTVSGGLNRFDGSEFHHFSRRNGLYSDGVWSITEAEDGRFWMTSDEGVFAVPQLEFDAVLDGSLERLQSTWLTEVDGMPSAQCNRAQPAVMKAEDGTLWVPTISGVAIVDLASIRVNRVAPQVMVWESESNGRRVHPKDLANLEPGPKNLTLRYSVLSLMAPDRNRVRYRLVGYDTGWQTDDNDGEIQYANVPPGSYRFEIQGANNDGIWSDRPAVTPIVFRSEILRNRWFLVSMLLSVVILGSIALQYRIRFRQREEQHRMRKLVARDLHDDLGSRIGSVSLLLDLASRNARSELETGPLLQRASDQLHQLGSDFRDSIWMVDSDHADLRGLVERMQAAAEKWGTQLQFEMEPAVEVTSRPMALDVRRNIYLLYREAVSNALRHANASTVIVSVGFESPVLTLEVVDDGDGFNPAVKSNGWGLESMRWRASALGSSLQIDSAPNAGTRLSISIDLDAAERRVSSAERRNSLRLW